MLCWLLNIGLPCAAAHAQTADVVSPQVRMPQDEAPHHDATEWWYFSGHLRGFDSLADHIFMATSSYFSSSIFRTSLNRSIKPTWPSPISREAVSSTNKRSRHSLFLTRRTGSV